MLRPIAIHLPQFHPIPENDKWWGKGFTEWTNVAKSRPLFEGHYQPHLPADLGFYDLRLEESRMAQAELAKAYGIYGFCYYHYWFNGRRLLEKPFQEIFESGKPDFPFMLCWANENWTRAWDGGEKDILLEQHYSEEDDRAHIKTLIPFFKDKRYIRIDNRPVFSIYRRSLLPDIENTIRIWREEAAKENLDLYLCNFEAFGSHGLNPGFDSSIEFQPFSETLNNFKLAHKNIRDKSNFIFFNKIRILLKTGFKKQAERLLHSFLYWIDYKEYVDFIIKNYKYPSTYKRFPGVTPSFDNTARKKENSYIFYNASPPDYEKWLMFHKKHYHPPSKEENFVFINAWNEWAEGNHLEPCQKWGLQYLEATKRVFSEDTL